MFTVTDLVTGIDSQSDVVLTLVDIDKLLLKGEIVKLEYRGHNYDIMCTLDGQLECISIMLGQLVPVTLTYDTIVSKYN